ncbi:MAG TPA: DUF5700 domain-containing putative Zn-dependent protease [Pyrinomonadaceae bacterium]|nr:DUF5700 domain-containing putative Zn-dependent protease [Pyrinomonadaceae bacterium]
MRKIVLTIATALLVTIHAFADDQRVKVTIVTDQADAVLNILDKRAANKRSNSRDWRRLVNSEGYSRLKAREESLGREFTEQAFIEFLDSPELAARRTKLAATLRAWRKMNVTAAAERALAYLPRTATIRAKIYPVIKPRDNSFVFDIRNDPAIFVYIDPAVTPEQFENMLAHELHHIGFGTACPSPETTTQIEALSAPKQNVYRWTGAFGEGFAMLAAAGRPDIHPHEFSNADDRSHWDNDIQNFARDLRTVESFFTDILKETLTDDAIITKARSFYGVQGPWYTVGWRMAAEIESKFGRETLIDCFCDQRKLFETYNRAATDKNAVWSDEFLKRLH